MFREYLRFINSRNQNEATADRRQGTFSHLSNLCTCVRRVRGDLQSFLKKLKPSLLGESSGINKSTNQPIPRSKRYVFLLLF